MRHVLIGKYVIPLWVLGVVLLGICIGAFALYIALTFTIPFEVKEPIEVLYYPSQLSLYPGETLYFNVTVRNHASRNYTVFLDFSLNNATYENSYVTFSNATYFVRPGVQNLTAWVIVSAVAPPMNAALTVNFFREASQDSCAECLAVASVEFSGSGTMIKLTVNNVGNTPVTISEVWINNTKKMTNPPLPQTVTAGNGLTLNITSPWVPGNTYQIKLISLRGNSFSYMVVAPSDFMQTEQLILTKQHVWYNTTGDWAEAAVVIINTGTLDIVLDKITVRGLVCPWTNVYYWKTNESITIQELQSTSTPITGDTFNLTIQGVERTFQRATDDLTLETGWIMIVYIMNPDTISSSDIGVAVSIIFFTTRAQYYKEVIVELMENTENIPQLVFENAYWYEENGIKKIDIYIRNIGTSDAYVDKIYMGTSPYNLISLETVSPLPVLIAPGSCARITITYAWIQGVTYYFRVVPITGPYLEFICMAPS